MAYICVFIIVEEFYDYFGGHKFSKKEFDSLIDAWNYFKNHPNWSYDDGTFYQCHRPIRIWEYKKETHTYHNKRKERKIREELEKAINYCDSFPWGIEGEEIYF